MTKYQVDSGVAVPRALKGSKYPWAEMEVGDSFFVPNGTGRGGRDTGNNACVSGRAWLRRNGLSKTFNFAQRKTVESGVKGARIWLMKKEND